MIKPYDQTSNRNGDLLTRLLVYIRVEEQFTTEGLDTLNMSPHWHDGSEHQITSSKMSSISQQDREEAKQIPFGKFFDINGADNDMVNHFELLKYHSTDTPEPTTLFLFKTNMPNKFYCVWGIDGLHSDWTESDFDDFIGTSFNHIKSIPPKSKDWHQTHYVYELTT